MTIDQIVPGTTYACTDQNGEVRRRHVDAIDTQSFISPNDRKVYFTDMRTGTLSSMYVRSFAKQVLEAVK